MSDSQQLIEAARTLAEDVDELRFSLPVTHVYNPLDYAWKAHEEYLRKFGSGLKRVVFLGMNPGPFGMVQTGIPFGEVAAVRDWLGITAPIGRPKEAHCKRPVLGFECHRSEVSGRRLWGLFARRFGSANKFFAEHFVVNYCPLAFCDEGGRNLTPDKFRDSERQKLFGICDTHLRRVLDILNPEWLVGVGAFAAERGRVVAEGKTVRVVQVLHPSPASPKANRNDWAITATNEMIQLGVWK